MKKFNSYRSYVLGLLAFLSVLTIAFIWSNSCLSRAESGAQSGFVTKLLRAWFDPNGTIPEETFHHFVRKGAHFAEFALLGLLVGGMFQAIRSHTGKPFYSLPVLIVLLVAVSDEYIQYFTDRGSAVKDVVLDFIGALSGLACIAFFTYVLRKKTAKK